MRRVTQDPCPLSVGLNGGLRHFFLLLIRAAGHAAHDPCRPGEGRRERGQGLVPVGGAGAAKRATAAKAWPCREREAEPLSSSKQEKGGAAGGAQKQGAAAHIQPGEPPPGAPISSLTVRRLENWTLTIWPHWLPPTGMACLCWSLLAGTAPGRASYNSPRSFRRSPTLLRFRNTSCRSTGA